MLPVFLGIAVAFGVYKFVSRSKSPEHEQPGSKWRALAESEAQKIKAMQTKLAANRLDVGRAPLRTAIKTGRQRMENYNAKAADEIFKHRNPSYPTDLTKCDLHWLRVGEAKSRATSHLDICRNKNVTQTEIVTGRGKHSVDGQARLRPAIKGLLDDAEGVKIVSEGIGSFVVSVTPKGSWPSGWWWS